MISKLLLGAFLLAAVMVLPSWSYGYRGQICRFVDATNNNTINQTSCPFSDLNPAPFECLPQASRGRGGYRGRRQDPTVIKYVCTLRRTVQEQNNGNDGTPVSDCTTDSDCLSVEGLTTARCQTFRSRRGRDEVSRCVPSPSSALNSVLCANPCEIRRGRNVQFEDLKQCQRQRRSYNSQTDSPRLVCEDTASLRVTVQGRNYQVKTCVPAPNNNNNNNLGDP